MKAEVVDKTDAEIAPETKVVVKTKDDIKELFTAVARLTGSFEEMFNDVGPVLTLGQWAVLDLLVSGGEHRPFELGKKLSISRQLAWRTVKKLENLDLVEVGGIEENARAVNISAKQGAFDLISKRDAIFEKVAAAMNEKRPASSVAPAMRTLSAITAILQASKSDAGES
ncbi:helix-turn-helix domain-containing protein [Paracoccus sp. MBLB3053]|uniref:Helix-turn-helix domain-containing protein n=1 Tax=Paracoccus aurantius TaxID=3073814 RepID=A0ABU2HU17_9RHOB|nr:helix-turn-helix domain-containing protein [Paracoccus sp. MBLB3053]MDS9468020.1 helix-turn-helix domain-containing protein [Paracoccus sp. MBLB3053]